MGRRQKRKATAEVDGTPSEEIQTTVSSEQKRKKKGRTSKESAKKGGAKDPGDNDGAVEEGIAAVRAEDLKEGDPGTLTGRPMRLYTDGIFDLLHYGHMRAIEQVKKAFPNTYVMVGCCSDAVTHKYKGLTVMAEDERYESLRHCKWVDEVIEDGPWVVTSEFLEKHQIDYVCHDALPYVDTSGQSAGGDVYGDLKKMGKFYETQRTEGVSTSDVISRIIVRYDEYVTRQLKRGYTAKDLNISPIKETELFIKKFAKSTNKSLKEMQRNFVDAFDRNSQIRTRFRQQRKQTWDKINGRINELAKTSIC